MPGKGSARRCKWLIDKPLKPSHTAAPPVTRVTHDIGNMVGYALAAQFPQKSFGTGMADELRFVADQVSSAIVPHSGHWIMEENPQATVKIVTEFLAK